MRREGANAVLGRNPKTKFSLPIADCRLKKWCGNSFQRPSAIDNRQLKIGNSSQPGPSDDRRNSSQETKNFGASAPARSLPATKSRFFAALRMTCHPDPALREKDLLFFAPRDEVGQ
jgi:hypothetical protein